MDPILGAGGLPEYFHLLLFYAALFLVMRYGHRTVEPAFRRTRLVLGLGWAIGTFVANYVLYRVGVMSFLPWLNNGLHTFVWIGICLSFLYAGAHRRPFLEQFALFAIFSFLVKAAEHALLGTWEHDNFFGIPGNAAYILGWSLMDGLYPVVSVLGLSIASRFVRGLVIPSLRGGTT